MQSQPTMTVQVGPYSIAVQGDPAPFELTCFADSPEDGIYSIHLELTAQEARQPPELTLAWQHALIETHQQWHPAVRCDRTLKTDWAHPHVTSKATSNAPVHALYSIAGQNALTFAVSDALNVIQCGAAVVEEMATAACRVTFFARPGGGPPVPFFMGGAPEPAPPMKQYAAVLRLDTRPVPYYEALADVSRWWSSLPDYAPSPVPEHARLPLYSTWYSFHQRLDPAAIEEQCRLAKDLGMETIIVDDGWQTDSNERGYAYCGDWEVTPNKLPDFRAHVDRVHEIGLKYVLWFSVPFVGVHSRAHERFRGKFLDPASPLPWNVLDPRFPDVRAYLIDIYRRFVTDYGIDGFKLDFVDVFRLTPEAGDAGGDGRDYESVPAAVNRLLTDVMRELTALNPDVLIEFRQSYIGPLMRKYGNMLRAMDVPDNFTGNRVNTLDVRLLSGETPAHADMFMWHPGEPVESAAMQLVHTLFSVPQVSVDLARIPAEHREMIRFYLSFWRRQRDVLLDGELMPLRPGELYPVVLARNEKKMLAACYAGGVVPLEGPLPPVLIVVNGTLADRLVLELGQPCEERVLTVTSCTGETQRTEALTLDAGVYRLEIPPAGVAELRQRGS
jgi:alpha-galactosidase